MALDHALCNVSTASNAVACAEKIVLLELISQLPGLPPDIGSQSLPREADEDDANKRVLSFRQENEIVSTLAFLSGVSNDPNHITAVSLEELPAAGGCKVLLAINKLNPNSGQDVLEKVQRGFEQIFRRLSNGASILNDIVALCRDRILSRLRVKASTAFSYKKDGRFIGDNLEEFLAYPWQTEVARPDMTEDHLRQYRTLSHALLEHLLVFNAAKAWKNENIVKLVQRIAEFMEKVPLRDVVESLKDHPMDSLAKVRLHSCLSKIARYRQSAMFLSRIVMKIPILRQVTVDHVCLEHAAFQRPSGTLASSNLFTALEAIPVGSGFLKIDNLPSWAQNSQQQFTTNLKKVLRTSKFHAEVQIVAHYEAANPEILFPRVIASSKDACYLCHAFIKLHGKYSVPKSHGKLYTGWRLPPTQCFEALGRNLQDFLEQEIRTNIMRFAQVQRKPPLTLPNESTLFPLNISASTLLSCLDLPSQIRHDQTTGQRRPKTLKDNLIAKPEEYQQHKNLHHPPSSSALQSIKSSIDGVVCAYSEMQCCSEAGGIRADDGVRGYLEEAKQHDETNAPPAVDSSEKLAGADDDVRPMSSIVTKSQGRTQALPDLMLFKEGRFCHEKYEIFIEDISLSTKIRWLSPADSAKVLRDKAGTVVDVLLLAAGTDTPFLRKDLENASYFSFGQQVVMIETSII
ncbi:hypothetical protein N0V82_004592 [Gnomoniopsis sp. IMI 355080]|nr:hypothetical protein N0V82_004592 [Gnomoniopsis sp. IMI 355080]